MPFSPKNKSDRERKKVMTQIIPDFGIIRQINAASKEMSKDMDDSFLQFEFDAHKTNENSNRAHKAIK